MTEIESYREEKTGRGCFRSIDSVTIHPMPNEMQHMVWVKGSTEDGFLVYENETTSHPEIAEKYPKAVQFAVFLLKNK